MEKNESAVKRIQQIYLFLAIVGFLIVIFILSGLSLKFSPKYSLEVFLPTAMNLAIYIGLKRKKDWIIPLILMFTAIGLLQHIVPIMHPAESIANIIEKLVSLFYFIFYMYQINLFTKYEVQQLFSFKGSVLL